MNHSGNHGNIGCCAHPSSICSPVRNMPISFCAACTIPPAGGLAGCPRCRRSVSPCSWYTFALRRRIVVFPLLPCVLYKPEAVVETCSNQINMTWLSKRGVSSCLPNSTWRYSTVKAGHSYDDIFMIRQYPNTCRHLLGWFLIDAD